MMHSNTIPPHRIALKTMSARHLSSRMSLEISSLALAGTLAPERNGKAVFPKSSSIPMATPGIGYGLVASLRAAANEIFGRAVLKAVALLRNVREN